MKVDPARVDEIKLLLDPVVAGGLTGQQRARLARRLRKLRGEGWLAALDRAVGRSIRRKRAAADLLADLIDLPEVKERFGEWLLDDDLDWRGEVIVLVGKRGLVALAPLLAKSLPGKAGELCQAYAITAAGELRSEACLPALLKVASNRSLDRLFRRTLRALTAYAHPDCRPPLERFYKTAKLKEVRILAAWGLGKLGDEKAIAYLVEMLDDPAVRTPTMYHPGESLRAAQALCDIQGWPFRWGKEGVARTRRRWQRLQRGE